MRRRCYFGTVLLLSRTRKKKKKKLPAVCGTLQQPATSSLLDLTSEAPAWLHVETRCCCLPYCRPRRRDASSRDQSGSECRCCCRQTTGLEMMPTAVGRRHRNDRCLSPLCTHINNTKWVEYIDDWEMRERLAPRCISNLANYLQLRGFYLETSLFETAIAVNQTLTVWCSWFRNSTTLKVVILLLLLLVVQRNLEGFIYV